MNYVLFDDTRLDKYLETKDTYCPNDVQIQCDICWEKTYLC